MSSNAPRTSWRPVAYTAVGDEKQRRQIGDALRDAGWTVVESRTGYGSPAALTEISGGKEDIRHHKQRNQRGHDASFA